ncbi:hypothetical protein E1267_19005 [Nonomuraea longispora]|uniref:Uncharacterized protein n=1 Tax=Nonomuraea longispora TaxID=1848320 RepID=A0A4R4N9C7_9ACTN|nr:hypothetical protein [Nonomuraea longispora]TDC05578.1 hypothetical protein E1267_19005 [Nonomuraea longispora]
MNFEEQLLMDLKTEIAARADRRRRLTRTRSVLGVAGMAAVAAIAVPLLTGTGTPAYAVSTNTDGTISVEINEFRDADKLEGDLKEAGVQADVSYVPIAKQCEPGRGEVVGGEPSTLEEFRDSMGYKAARVRTGGVDIDPRYVGQGQTLVMEFAENKESAEGGVITSRFKALVMTGPVEPCTLVDWDVTR